MKTPEECASPSEIVGPYAWGILHHAVESFPCGSCAREGTALLHFAHDLVNLKLGKPLQSRIEEVRPWIVLANDLGGALARPMARPAAKEGPGPRLVAEIARRIKVLAQAAPEGLPRSERERWESCVLKVRERNQGPGCPPQGTGARDCPIPYAVCTARIGGPGEL